MAYEYQEYPRILYRGAGESRIVTSDTDKADAIAEGWSLTEHEPAPAPDPEPEPEPVAVKRGRKPKAE